MQGEELREKLAWAVRAAREAGAITLDYFGAADLEVGAKADASPVTEADRRGEEHIRQLIGETFPNDGILGEEFGETVGTSGVRWILDPIDGTKSFVRSVPLYGTLVGMEAEGDVLAGAVYVPALDEIVYAAKGMGAWWVPSPAGAGRRHCEAGTGPLSETCVRARVSTVGKLCDALFGTTSADYFATTGRLDLFERLRQASALERGWSDCYGHLLVATGRVDYMIDPGLRPWDCAALKPIVEEAGGTFTDLAGNATIYGGSGVSTNGELFEELMALIGERDPSATESGR